MHRRWQRRHAKSPDAGCTAPERGRRWATGAARTAAAGRSWRSRAPDRPDRCQPQWLKSSLAWSCGRARCRHDEATTPSGGRLQCCHRDRGGHLGGAAGHRPAPHGDELPALHAQHQIGKPQRLRRGAGRRRWVHVNEARPRRAEPAAGDASCCASVQVDGPLKDDDAVGRINRPRTTKLELACRSQALKLSVDHLDRLMHGIGDKRTVP